MNHLSPKELEERLQRGEQLMLLDVRLPEEYQICNLSHKANTMLAPLNNLPGCLQHIPKDKPLVAYCHHGIRSQYAIQYLQQQGYTDLYNLAGGIQAWAEEVEPDMEQY